MHLNPSYKLNSYLSHEKTIYRSKIFKIITQIMNSIKNNPTLIITKLICISVINLKKLLILFPMTLRLFMKINI